MIALVIGLATLIPPVYGRMWSHEPTLEVAQEAWLHGAFYFPGLVALFFGLVLPEREREDFKLPVQTFGAALFILALYVAWLCAQRRHQLAVLARHA